MVEILHNCTATSCHKFFTICKVLELFCLFTLHETIYHVSGQNWFNLIQQRWDNLIMSTLMRQAATHVSRGRVWFCGTYRCCGTAIVSEFSLVGAGGFSEEGKKKTYQENNYYIFVNTSVNYSLFHITSQVHYLQHDH